MRWISGCLAQLAKAESTLRRSSLDRSAAFKDDVSLIHNADPPHVRRRPVGAPSALAVIGMSGSIRTSG